MTGRLHSGRVLMTVVAALSLLLVSGAAAEAAAAPPGSSGGVAAIPPPPERCWPSGTRIKSPSSPTVYLIGPYAELYLIRDETTYFRLFNSWSGLVVTTDWSCYGMGDTLIGARLVKTASSPKVYLAYGGLYRWIPNETTFNYYNFAWSKIQVVPSVGTGDPWTP